MVQVTLKKASALAVALAAKQPKIEHEFSVSIYANDVSPVQAIAYEEQFATTLTDAMNVVAAVADIRRLVGVANQGKINELIHEKAALDKLLAVVASVPARKVSDDIEVFNRLKAAKQGEAPSAYGKATGAIVFQVGTSEAQDNALSTLRKQRIKCEDELIRLNYSTLVEIPKDVEELLRQYDLI